MDIAELSSSLRSVISSLHKGLRKRMNAANTYSMTEMETIAHLARSSALLPTTLASLTRVKTQTMSQIIKKLEMQGIIKRTPSGDDKRKIFISLTTRGKKWVENTKYERDEWLKKAIEKSLSGKEREALVKVLPILNKLAEIN